MRDLAPDFGQGFSFCACESVIKKVILQHPFVIDAMVVMPDHTPHIYYARRNPRINHDVRRLRQHPQQTPCFPS